MTPRLLPHSPEVISAAQWLADEWIRNDDRSRNVAGHFLCVVAMGLANSQVLEAGRLARRMVVLRRAFS